MKLKRGFTIVEVLVVIGIIAILTVIIFPSINNIRAKNRDAEKVADIAAIQLGLSMYFNQHPTEGYPKTIFSNGEFFPKYVPEESLISPNNQEYKYVPLKRGTSDKCSYYHLGVELELPSAQIDTADNFTSFDLEEISNDYVFCGNNEPENGIATGTQKYNVRP
jgi:prepilin-type N-terminal cleavage/methylation domain-containing protein